jgi:hypothetical protein
MSMGVLGLYELYNHMDTFELSSISNKHSHTIIQCMSNKDKWSLFVPNTIERLC